MHLEVPQVEVLQVAFARALAVALVDYLALGVEAAPYLAVHAAHLAVCLQVRQPKAVSAYLEEQASSHRVAAGTSADALHT